MATILIRKLPDEVKSRLRTLAAEHGRSVEAEAREIIRSAVSQSAKPKGAKNLAAAIRKTVEPFGGFELELPPREPMPEPPKFD